MGQPLRIGGLTYKKMWKSNGFRYSKNLLSWWANSTSICKRLPFTEGDPPNDIWLRFALKPKPCSSGCHGPKTFWLNADELILFGRIATNGLTVPSHIQHPKEVQYDPIRSLIRFEMWLTCSERLQHPQLQMCLPCQRTPYKSKITVKNPWKSIVSSWKSQK